MIGDRDARSGVEKLRSGRRVVGHMGLIRVSSVVGPSDSRMNGESNLSMQRQAPITGVAGEGRAPTILQVLPSLVTGGVERGTADVSTALVQAGWRSVVVSS